MAHEELLDGLRRTPVLLKELMNDIPEEFWTRVRKPKGWSLFEHAAHLVKTQEIMNARLQKFLQEERPAFVPYTPDDTQEKRRVAPAQWPQLLEKFTRDRTEFVERLKSLTPEYWNRQGDHPEYQEYTPLVLARLVFFHENLHMSRIMMLWQLKEEFLG